LGQVLLLVGVDTAALENSVTVDILKDPLRTFAQSADLIRARLVPPDHSVLADLLVRLTKVGGVVLRLPGGGGGKFECLRLKNGYHRACLDPSHFRHCVMNLKFSYTPTDKLSSEWWKDATDTTICVVEIQVSSLFKTLYRFLIDPKQPTNQ